MFVNGSSKWCAVFLDGRSISPQEFLLHWFVEICLNVRLFYFFDVLMGVCYEWFYFLVTTTTKK